MEDGFKFEVWVADHGHIDNHQEWVGDADNIMDLQRLVNKAIRKYPIFTSDEIVIHTVQSPHDDMEPSHYTEWPADKPEKPEATTRMPKGKVQYLITVEEV